MLFGRKKSANAISKVHDILNAKGKTDEQEKNVFVN